MKYIPERGYIGKNPLRWFTVRIWNFTIKVKSDKHGAARYEAWQEFHDVYDISFGDFCKQSKVTLV